MADIVYPRVTIEFCTQCKWNLRAAYFAQELLQTFGNTLGEVSMIPSTGGIFTVKIQHKDPATSSIQTKELWDRKTEGGFPEIKELKRRVRDVIEPGRDLGHVDGHKIKKEGTAGADLRSQLVALAEGAEASGKSDAEKVKQESTVGEDVREKLKADMEGSEENGEKKEEKKECAVCEDCQ